MLVVPISFLVEAKIPTDLNFKYNSGKNSYLKIKKEKISKSTPTMFIKENFYLIQNLDIKKKLFFVYEKFFASAKVATRQPDPPVTRCRSPSEAQPSCGLFSF